MENNIPRSVPSYEEACKECIADMKNISESFTFKLKVGTESYSTDEIITAIEQGTEFGKQYVNNFIKGIERLQKK